MSSIKATRLWYTSYKGRRTGWNAIPRDVLTCQTDDDKEPFSELAQGFGAKVSRYRPKQNRPRREREPWRCRKRRQRGQGTEDRHGPRSQNLFWPGRQRSALNRRRHEAGSKQRYCLRGSLDVAEFMVAGMFQVQLQRTYRRAVGRGKGYANLAGQDLCQVRECWIIHADKKRVSAGGCQRSFISRR
jgi:hypothetical protein